MSSTQDVDVIREFLNRARARIATLAMLKGAAAGLVLAALYVLVTTDHSTSISLTAVVAGALAIVGAISGYVISARERTRAALNVEQRAANCHNLLVTSEQLLAVRNAAPIHSVVFRQAARAIKALQLSVLFPAGQSMAMLGGAALLMAAGFAFRPVLADRAPAALSATSARAKSIDHVDLVVTPPSYTGRAPQSLRDPARIDAFVGSTIKLIVKATSDSVVIETLLGKQPLAKNSDGNFTGSIVADADGFVAIQPVSATGVHGVRKLIGVLVTTDNPPRVRLTAPGKDMMLPDGNRTLGLVVEANDDLALQTVRMRYTQVSGSGERFTFKEGEVPLQLTRNSDTAWVANAKWNLAALELEAGDMVVYRAVANDKRPGSPSVESDSYIAEVMMPGGDAAAGFAIDPDQERYALSQQMIIVKTERLMAKRTTLAASDFADQANEIAMEQRRVRAEFVFMMGGELEDAPLPDEDMTTLHEEAEAEGESDIMAGRGANQGRVALQRAIRAMSAAATKLNAVNVSDALGDERVALKQLERAFSHTRIILRALTQQERLDLTRRMTGPLLEAGRDVRPSALAEGSARVVALRGALAGVAELMAATAQAGDASARTSALAERVLRVNSSDKVLQDVSARLNDAAAAFGKQQSADAMRSLEVAAVALTATIRGGVVAAPAPARSFSADRMDGALSDILRRSRSTR